MRNVFYCHFDSVHREQDNTKMSAYEREIIGGFRSLQIHSERDDLRAIFDAVVAVYRRFEQVCGHAALRDWCLSHMACTKTIYRHNMRAATNRVDFSNTLTRWAYMYVYMLRHIHLVFFAWDLAVQESVVCVNPAGEAINVCMIGGGPGSDVLGLVMFLSKYGCPSSVVAKVDVLDKCTAWAESWEHLYNYLPGKYRVGIPSVRYHEFDYLKNHLRRESCEIVRGADIVTMIKSLSPAATWLKDRQPFAFRTIAADGRLIVPTNTVTEWHSVYSILANMKPGAFLLYMDNKTGPQREILMGAARCLNLEVLFDRVLYGVSLPTDVFSSDARRLMEQLNGYKPCSQAGTNEVILLKKNRGARRP